MESREEITVRIKEAADIVQVIGENVELRKSGARFLGLCPFHGEKTPSFTVHPGNQFFHCFGCGESGDVFSFMMKYHNLDFPEAVKNLAKRYNIALPERRVTAEQQKREQLRQTMFTINQKAAELFSTFLQGNPGADEAMNYLAGRKIPKDVQQRFGLGYAPSQTIAGWNYLGAKLKGGELEAAVEAGLLVKKEKGGTYDRFRDRIMFPIYDISGQVCGFGGRIVGEGQPKYMNSPESPVYNKSKSLLGLYQLKDSIRKRGKVILVEGNFDLISLVVHGCDNVVAPLGTALTREQVRLLKRFADEAVLLFDGDSAGVKAALRAVPLFLAEQMKGKVALLPEGHDPDTFVQEFGITKLEQLIGKAEELSEFTLTHLIAEHGLSLEGKTKVVEELRPLVKAAASSLQRSVVIAHFAQKLNIQPDQLEDQLRGDFQPTAPPPPPPEPERDRTGYVAPLSPSQKRLVNFMILHPEKFTDLEEVGLREALAGSTGEVLFLQVQSLSGTNPELQPEDILSQLPEGAERKLVADILLKAMDGTGHSEGADGEERDCLAYLKRVRLKNQSERILKKIHEAQVHGNFEQLQTLLMEKQAIDRKLQSPL